MKETFWGYWLVLLGILIIGVMLLVNNITSTKLGMYIGSENNDWIENNTVIADYENAIYLQKTNNTFIRNNYLESQELKGDSAVIDNKGTGNVIENKVMWL